MPHPSVTNSIWFQVDRIVPGTLPPSITGSVILVVRKADGDEEVGDTLSLSVLFDLNVQ